MTWLSLVELVPKSNISLVPKILSELVFLVLSVLIPCSQLVFHILYRIKIDFSANNFFNQ